MIGLLGILICLVGIALVVTGRIVIGLVVFACGLLFAAAFAGYPAR